MTIARISSYYILNDVFHIRFMLDGDMQLTTDNDKISLKYRSIDKDYSYPMKYKVKDKSIHAWIKLSDVAECVIFTILLICDENVLKDSLMLCSSPMSAKIWSNT